MKFTLASLLLLLTFQVHAAGKGVDFRLLNYSEFTSLSRDDRAAYIEEMRLAALRSEREQGGVARVDTTVPSVWVSAFLSQAYAASGDMCIYAGYVSRRDSQNRCVAPSGSSGSCGSGKTQCNPLLYGYGPGNGGICTSSRSTPTNDCEDQYQKIPNYKAYQVADQVVAHKDMQAKFDAQAAELNTYCGSSISSEQKGLCTKLKQKTVYMKAKIEAAEKRKKAAAAQVEKEKQAKAQAADAQKEAAQPETKTPEAQPEVKAPTATASAATVAKPSSEVTAPPSGTAAAAAPTAAPAAPEAKAAAAPAPAAPTAEEKAATAKAAADKAAADKLAAAKKKATPGACITNLNDYIAKKDTLNENFQTLDKTDLMYSGKATFPSFVGDVDVTSTMKLSIDDKTGKMQLRSAVKTNSSAAGSWVAEDGVKSICPLGANGVMITTLDGRQTQVTTSASGSIVAKTKQGAMSYGLVKSEREFDSATAKITGSGLALWVDNVNTGKTAR